MKTYSGFNAESYEYLILREAITRLVVGCSVSDLVIGSCCTPEYWFSEPHKIGRICMKSKVLTFLALIVSGGVLVAAAHQPKAPAAKNAMPVIVIQEVETDSPETYALLIADANKAIKEKFHLDNYTKVFVGEAAGPDSGKAFAVSANESFAKLVENNEAFDKELSLVKGRIGLSQIRKLGPRVALKAVRFEGRNDTSVVFNTRVVLSDEAGYLTSLDGLRTLLDSHDFKDIKINCYRAVSGRSDYTHLVSMNAPSATRRAAMMDAITSEQWASEWIASAAKYRTVVSNGTYRELAH